MKNKAVTKETMKKVLEWFAYGRVGSSSKFIAVYLTTGEGRGDYPHDPDDLNRYGMLDTDELIEYFEDDELIDELKTRGYVVSKED